MEGFTFASLTSTTCWMDKIAFDFMILVSSSLLLHSLKVGLPFFFLFEQSQHGFVHVKILLMLACIVHMQGSFAYVSKWNEDRLYLKVMVDLS